ncbi:MAG: PilZ domain-containing protein [Candidatus Velthaea sp.]
MFSFGKKPPAGRAKPAAASAGDQKRGAYRASVEFPVLYTVEGRPGSRTATANDLSASGMRLIGDEDLSYGSVLDFHFTLPNELIRSVHVEKEIEEKSPLGNRKKWILVPPPPFDPMSVRAKVVIAFFNVRRRKFAHGIQFLSDDERFRDEIARFIHLWQLRQLRERAERELGSSSPR